MKGLSLVLFVFFFASETIGQSNKQITSFFDFSIDSIQVEIKKWVRYKSGLEKRIISKNHKTQFKFEELANTLKSEIDKGVKGEYESSVNLEIHDEDLAALKINRSI